MSGFRKFDQDKPPMHLVPARALEEVARVMGVGAKKYGELNWTKCEEPHRFVAAALRHLNEQVRVLQDTADEWVVARDVESGLPSLAHAAASCMLALELMLKPDKGLLCGTYDSIMDHLEKFDVRPKETRGDSGS